MPIYKYTAKNQFGETVKGKVEVKEAGLAAGVLAEQKLFLIDLQSFSSDPIALLKDSLFGVKQNDVVNFTRQLSTMVSAGLPLTNSLSILVDQSKLSFGRVVASILQEVEGGAPLAKALEKHPKVFSRLYTQLVLAGETGGVLDSVLLRLADNMEKQKDFRSKTKGALIYPIIVIIAMLIVAVVMMVFVIPKMMLMYNDFGATLPLPTRILIGASTLMIKLWWLLGGLVVIGIFGFKRYKKTDKGQLKVDQLVLKIPIIGVLITKIALTEFARTLALLLGAGVSLLQTLSIVTEGLENQVFRTAMKQVSANVEKGQALSTALTEFPIFPPILTQMTKVGEETGKLDEVLKKLSDYFESESAQAVKNLTTAIEPMIMIVLGIGVAFLVIAIILPIYNLTSQF